MNRKIYCENNNELYDFTEGESLLELSKRVNHGCEFPVIAALVDNRLKELAYEIYISKKVEFIDYSHTDGVRTYIRTLSFVLQKAVRDLYPDYDLQIDYSLPSGLYAEIIQPKVLSENTERTFKSNELKLSEEDIQKIKDRMLEIISANHRITRRKVTIEEAEEIFIKNRQPRKFSVLKQSGKYFVSVYTLDDYVDTFYGPLLHSTGYITSFDLFHYMKGLCLQAPSYKNEELVIEKRKPQDKLSHVFQENSDWCAMVGTKDVGSINEIIQNKETKEMIQIAEAMHERKYAAIADQIYSKIDDVRLILISGPSSSGKTTTSKRLALQTQVLGLRPIVIAMDNYFVDREHTPLDENGEYDFEALNALDLPFFNQQLNDLFEGKEVEVPKFNFVEGKRYFDGEKIQLTDKNILIMEGIHALNPELIKNVPQERIFRIFASALTSLSLDENNTISTSDNRLLRRMVRDNRTRGTNPESTIMRWPSVRRGEKKNIFPFQENADIMFNSMLPYELALLKYYAEPVLHRIPAISPAHAEAVRLLKFLSHISALTPEEMEIIPPTSVIREFIGGSSFDY